MDIQKLAKNILKSDRRSLAKALTLIESTRKEDRKKSHLLLNALTPHSGKSLRIGISGVPGVGKSSFIEVLGLEFLKHGHKVAVLAVDPSSPLSGGSILGDKTRMERLSREKKAFIRPTPSLKNLGGVAQKTRESIHLCEANGYDIILIETVGVGQSEYEVNSMVDLFALLMLPNAGDELQGIKKGIMELSDLIIINKADGETQILAENTRNQYENALHITRDNPFWTPKVLTCSALYKKGISEIIETIFEYERKTKENKSFEIKRKKQIQDWLKSLFQEKLKYYIENNSKIIDQFSKIEKDVLLKKKSMIQGSEDMIKVLLSKS